MLKFVLAQIIYKGILLNTDITQLLILLRRGFFKPDVNSTPFSFNLFTISVKPIITEEIVEIEELYDIHLPPDLKEFLMFALPISNGFVNWRDKSKENIEKITDQLNWTLKGIIFDIEHNEFWMEDWGEKPTVLEDAVKIASINYKKAPKLIPINGHRYIPSSPFEKGNPIFSVWQTDIIYYGKNLMDYLLVEFGFKKQQEIDFKNVKIIPFWYDIIMSW